MDRHRIRCLPIALSVAITGIVCTPATALAQPAPRDMVRRFTVEQWERFRPLFTLVEDASAGRPVPSDLAVAWKTHVLKAEAHMNFVLFTLKVPRGGFTAFPLAMYVRVVRHGAVATAPGPRDALAQYPFEDVAFFDEAVDGRISRAFAAPPGRWDVYIALREAVTSDVLVPKTVVFRSEVELPDLSTDLAVSSIIVADRVRFVEADLFEANISEASVVTVYLLSSLNLKLRPKLMRELKPGTRVVSHAFDMGDWKPERELNVKGRRVFLWTIPKQ